MVFKIVMGEERKNQQFNELLEQHKGILFKVSRGYCQDEEDRKDLIQEICIQIWRSLDKYNDQYKISTWLYQIALNVAISFYRKDARRKVSTITWENQLPHLAERYDTEMEASLNLLEQFIHELNDLDKALILLYLDDKSYSEIADILGISQSNVGTKIGRIKGKLKTRFSQVNS